MELFSVCLHLNASVIYCLFLESTSCFQTSFIFYISLTCYFLSYSLRAISCFFFTVLLLICMGLFLFFPLLSPSISGLSAFSIPRTRSFLFFLPLQQPSEPIHFHPILLLKIITQRWKTERGRHEMMVIDGRQDDRAGGGKKLEKSAAG